MKDPICLVKNGLVYPIENLGLIERPFAFRIAEDRLGVPNQFQVSSEEQPIYFARRRMRVKKGQIVERYVHLYCVGVRRKDGSTEKHWVTPRGEYAGLNLEPDKKII